jgi:putative copper export protein
VILAALQNGEVGYAGAAVLLRAVYYLGSLGGAGLAFFSLLFAERQDVADASRLHRWVLGAVALGLLAALGSLSVQVGVLTGGERRWCIEPPGAGAGWPGWL